MGGTDCGAYRLGLGVYAIGRLAGAEADALSAHLRGCSPCRAELAELRTAAELLAHSVRPDVRPDARPDTRPGARSGPARGSAGRGPRTGASRMGLSGACAYGPRGPGRPR
ncbi:Predicted transmembrane transcriptional regulator (anti-sigma factor) [Mycobacterium tuberculosis]|nr:Predicted transmembrane transcriptional regulator (anti-sigma factor) [Mycobacterium tuberculosis]